MFWYRQSPGWLVASRGSRTAVTRNDPHPGTSGEVRMLPSPDGELIQLRVVPPRRSEPGETAGEFDWSVLFEASGLPMEEFTPVEPSWVPDDFADVVREWEGVWPGAPDLPTRVQAAGYRGRPVQFAIYNPYDPSWNTGQRNPPQTRTMILWILTSLILLARRNLRLGRGDRQGAFKLAAFVLLLETFRWIVNTDHVPHVGLEFNRSCVRTRP